MPWLLVTSGLMLGLLGACVPGFPGAAVALVGVAAAAAVGSFEVIGGDALFLAALLALAGGFAQLLAPVWGVRLLSRGSGAATGAAAGATLGLAAPLPLGAILFGTVGTLLGTWLGRARFVSRLAAIPALAGTALVAVTVDVLAVLGIGAVVAVSDLLAR